ncbi:MAG: hypothetical protein HRU38_02620 [Saccharospirillaceae bacterium]|nr:ATP-binding protein [Pseudomonadales bacterium]NRB77555.1 hypothetical protein [Saccharospirillaceae bacterium]
MKRLFVTLYLKLVIGAGVSLLITWVLFSAINTQRENQYWQQQMSGISYLMQQGASRHTGEARMAWLTLTFRIAGLPFELKPEKTDSVKSLKIKKKGNKFTGKIPLDNQIINFEFSIISKQFMEGINKLISHEIALNEKLELSEKLELDIFIKNLAQNFSYPIQIINSDTILLSEFEKRQLKSGLIIFRFDNGISAISSFGQNNKLLKAGAIKPFNPYPTSLLVIACFILFLLSLLLSLFLIKPLEKRLSVFSKQVELIKLNQKNIFNNVNIKQEGNDELAKLSENVDDMAKRIIQYANDQQHMTRSVSHEIRTPLVKMNYRLARIDYDHLSEAQKKNIEGLKRNMGELDSLINELLLYSSLDQMPNPELIEIDIQQFLQQQINKLQHLSDIDITLNDYTGPELVQSFPNYLSRILQNLLTNAQRYAKNTITVSVIHKTGQFALVVEDDGIGISKELAHKIFEPFYVDDESRNSALNGHGLGLSIVRKMTELLNGEVEIFKSDQYGGAKFVLTFKE